MNLSTKNKILFIGDTKSVTWDYCCKIKKRAFIFSSTKKLEEAHVLCTTNRYTIIILDLDSLEERKIKARAISDSLKNNEETAFLFISSKEEKKFLEELPEHLPQSNFILKPLTFTIFNLAVTNLLLQTQSKLELKQTKKKYEKKAILAEISYEDLFYSLPQEIILINLEGIIVTINRIGELSFGENSKKLLNTHFTKSPFFKKILSSDDQILNFLNILKNEDLPPPFEFRFEKKNKSILYTKISYNLMVVSGKFQIQVTLENITEKKKSEKKAEEIYSEILSFDIANKALLRGDSLDDIADVLLNILTANKEVQSTRLYLYNEKEQKLNLFSDKLNKNITTIIEDKIGIKLSGLIPDITKEPIFKKIINDKKPYITSNKNEIIKIISAHTNNPILKKFSTWAQKIINSKTFGILPLLKNDRLIGLITFSSERVLDKSEIDRLNRFTGHATTILEKKLNENNLAESEERFKLAMEGANDGLWDWNVLTNETYFSPRWKSMLGYQEHELDNVQQTWENLIHPEDKVNAIKTVNDYLDGKTNYYESEFRLRHKDGHYVYILDRGHGLRDKKGQVFRMNGTHVDITERKKNENFLKQLNTSISFKTGPSYFSEFTQFCCTTLNVKYAFVGHFYKKTNVVETLSFHSNGKELKPYRYNLVNTPCEQVLGGNECVYPKNVQKRFPKDTDLQKFGIESYFGMPLLDDNNNPIGIIVLLDDKPMINIEEKSFLLSILVARTANELSRNLSHKKLLESEERYRGLFEKMHEGLLVTNNNKLILNVNKSFCRMIGYEENEIIGKSGYQLFHDEETQNRLLSKVSERKKGNSEIYELEFITKSGKKIWTQVSSSPYYDYEGKFSGVLSIVSNISQRKKHELQLQKTVDELNNRNNELMQFNYIVSHNLRSPIANILGLVNIASLPNITLEEKTKIPDYIKNSALKMDELVKDLSVILATRSTLNVKKESVSISKVLRSIFDLLEKQISDSETTITSDISTDAESLITIRSYLESILYNLISNAIKYKSSERKPKILISTKIEKGNFIISVWDNGIGIDLEKHKDQMFGLYKRFTYDTEGKGLGLHMTKNQVQALGGEILVKSILGRETEFIVTFKLNKF